MPFLVTCLIQQYSPHCLGSRREKMSSRVPLSFRIGTDEPEIRFVNQSGRLKCLSGFLVHHSNFRKFATLFIHKRQQLIRRTGVAGFDFGQDCRNVVINGVAANPFLLTPKRYQKRSLDAATRCQLRCCDTSWNQQSQMRRDHSRGVLPVPLERRCESQKV